MTDSPPVQRYGPTSGLGTGIAGLVCCAVIVAAVLSDPLSAGSVRVLIGALVLAVLVWAFQMRPRIVIEADERSLLLRNPLISRRIPMAAIRSVAVKTMTSIGIDEDRHYTCVAVGYSLRRVVKDRSVPPPKVATPDSKALRRRSLHEEQRLMQDRVLAAADRARARHLPTEPVEREFAVVELSLLAALVVAFVVSFFF